MRYLLLSVLLVASCASGDKQINEPDIMGANYSFSIANFEDTYGSIINSLEVAGPISIVAQVDHVSNAVTVDKELAGTRTVFFGNPALGTPFMQENQQAGLDLPQKISVSTGDNDKVVVIYNSIEYLKSRHGVDPATAAKVAGALEKITSKATGAAVNSNKKTCTINQGVITVDSDQDFDTTYATLIAALQTNPKIKIVAQLDHQANAARVNLKLRPTKVVIFGNPALGTPLLQENGSISLDLPQKMLVYELADGSVKIAYNDATYIASRHQITTNLSTVPTINNALSKIAATAAGR